MTRKALASLSLSALTLIAGCGGGVVYSPSINTQTISDISDRIILVEKTATQASYECLGETESSKASCKSLLIATGGPCVNLANKGIVPRDERYNDNPPKCVIVKKHPPQLIEGRNWRYSEQFDNPTECRIRVVGVGRFSQNDHIVGIEIPPLANHIIGVSGKRNIYTVGLEQQVLIKYINTNGKESGIRSVSLDMNNEKTTATLRIPKEPCESLSQRATTIIIN